MGAVHRRGARSRRARSRRGGRHAGRDRAVSRGVAASAWKAGSRYSFLIASTCAEFCPPLKEQLGEKSRVPVGVSSIMEIVINGRSLEAVTAATYAAIDAAVKTPGLVKITAGNDGGRLGKSFIDLRPGRRD